MLRGAVSEMNKFISLVLLLNWAALIKLCTKTLALHISSGIFLISLDNLHSM